MKKLALVLSIMTLVIGLSGCGNDQSSQEPSVADEKLRTVSAQSIVSLQNENFAYLSQLVHPEKGVRFSPYAFVDMENDVVLTAEELKFILADSRSFTWGEYDGIGGPIDLPFLDYYKKFIYDRDFFNAEEKVQNQSVGSGNSLNNLETVYKDAQYIEYHFPGFNPEYGGMDWASLRLVFEEYKGELFLVGIVHDQWTI